ncbi:MAG: hypothetical protein ACFCUI_08305 [Bernardetiaceae bacterium]
MIESIYFFGATNNGFGVYPDQERFSAFDQSHRDGREVLRIHHKGAGRVMYTYVRYGLRTGVSGDVRKGSKFGCSLVLDGYYFVDPCYVLETLAPQMIKAMLKQDQLLREVDGGQLAFVPVSLGDVKDYLDRWREKLASELEKRPERFAPLPDTTPEATETYYLLGLNADKDDLQAAFLSTGHIEISLAHNAKTEAQFQQIIADKDKQIRQLTFRVLEDTLENRTFHYYSEEQNVPYPEKTYTIEGATGPISFEIKGNAHFEAKQDGSSKFRVTYRPKNKQPNTEVAELLIRSGAATYSMTLVGEIRQQKPAPVWKAAEAPITVGYHAINQSITKSISLEKCTGKNTLSVSMPDDKKEEVDLETKSITISENQKAIEVKFKLKSVGRVDFDLTLTDKQGNKQVVTLQSVGIKSDSFAPKESRVYPLLVEGANVSSLSDAFTVAMNHPTSKEFTITYKKKDSKNSKSEISVGEYSFEVSSASKLPSPSLSLWLWIGGVAAALVLVGLVIWLLWIPPPPPPPPRPYKVYEGKREVSENSTIDFGQIKEKVTKNFSIADETIGEVIVYGDQASAFVALSKGSTNFQITFAPGEAGDYSANVELRKEKKILFAFQVKGTTAVPPPLPTKPCYPTDGWKHVYSVKPRQKIKRFRLFLQQRALLAHPDIRGKVTVANADEVFAAFAAVVWKENEALLRGLGITSKEQVQEKIKVSNPTTAEKINKLIKDRGGEGGKLALLPDTATWEKALSGIILYACP